MEVRRSSDTFSEALGYFQSLKTDLTWARMLLYSLTIILRIETRSGLLVRVTLISVFSDFSGGLQCIYDLLGIIFMVRSKNKNKLKVDLSRKNYFAYRSY